MSFALLRPVFVLLTKPAVCGLPQTPLKALSCSFWRKRKEDHMRPKAKKQEQNQERKEVSKMFEVSRIHRIEGNDTLKAFVDIKVADSVLIKGLRVMASKNDTLFVAMPSQKAEDGKYYPTVKPLTKEANQELQDAVLSAYNG
jgi:DNA-binding cell septation regulator SpoVG